jgi:hypothetical protein
LADISDENQEMSVLEKKTECSPEDPSCVISGGSKKTKTKTQKSKSKSKRKRKQSKTKNKM